MSTLHIIAAALGAQPDGPGSDCAVCGASPFAAGKPAKKVFGPNFTDYDHVRGGSDDVCAGCAAVLGGKPGSTPPPLRMSSFVVDASGTLERAGMDRMAVVLRMAEPVQAVGWAISRQKHASLRCGPCSPTLYRIGCDHGTIEWTPDHVPLLDAVAELRRSCRQDQILTGSYPPHVIAAMGARWQDAEEIVRPHRGSLALEMAVALVRRPEPTEEAPPPMNIPDAYREAARLLAPLCRYSAFRDEDPIAFWSSLLPRRLAGAASSVSLIEWYGYLIRELRVAASRAEVVGGLSAHVTDEAAVLRAVRTDHRLLIAVVRMLRDEE